MVSLNYNFSLKFSKLENFMFENSQITRIYLKKKDNIYV